MNALDYISRGWAPIPIPYRVKGPVLPGWTSLRVTPETVSAYFTSPGNIGVLLGAPSAWLVDVDLDCLEAIRLAPELLPSTLTFGRASRMRSHWLYVAEGLETRKYAANGSLVEIRSTGAQTVFPGSTHPSGELIEFSGGDLLEVHAEKLSSCVRALACATFLVRSGWTDADAVAWARNPDLEHLNPEEREVLSLWLGVEPVTATVHGSRPAAITAYNAAHPLSLPRSLGTCPVCKHNDCFGRVPGNHQRWSCFSAAHGETGVGVAGRGCWTGDAFDLSGMTLGELFSGAPLEAVRAIGATWKGDDVDSLRVLREARAITFSDPAERADAERELCTVLGRKKSEIALPRCKAVRVEASPLKLDVSITGTILDSLSNVLRVLASMSETPFWYDTFLQKICTPSGVFTDENITAFTDRLQTEYGLKRVSSKLVEEALKFHASKHIRNCVVEYLDSLTWDGVDRLSTFCANALGTENNEYTRAVGSNFWHSLVVRVLQPGSKVDTMVVLEGPQGSRKSTALAYIAGDWFGEATEAPTHKDFFMALQGKLIVEIGEMDAFRRVDVAAVKRALSCRIDDYRVPYGRVVQSYPRQGIFAGTTNHTDWAQDATGARRFWPLTCGDISLAYITDNRDQCFAQATHEIRAGATWWEMPIQQTLEEQSNRRQEDPWEPTILEFLSTQSEVRPDAILRDVIGFQTERMTHRDVLRVRNVLRQEKWAPHDVKKDGKVVKIWVSTKR